jgi:hypothetical protein
LATRFPEGPNYLTSDQKFTLWRQQTGILKDLAGFRFGIVNVTGVDTPVQAQVSWVTSEYFPLYGIPLARGRAFTAEETQPSGPQVTVLTNGFWKRAFGGKPGIVGKTISLNDSRYEVVGIVAAGVETNAPQPIDADFNMLLLTIFSVAAVLLAAIGVYGLMAYVVQRRNPEIAIRIALGADVTRVRNMIVFQGLRLAVIGVALGTAAALVLSRFIASFLFHVDARDPVVFIAAPLVLGAIALIATWVPALRAAYVDPADALRS